MTQWDPNIIIILLLFIPSDRCALVLVPHKTLFSGEYFVIERDCGAIPHTQTGCVSTPCAQSYCISNGIAKKHSVCLRVLWCTLACSKPNQPCRSKSIIIDETFELVGLDFTVNYVQDDSFGCVSVSGTLAQNT